MTSASKGLMESGISDAVSFSAPLKSAASTLAPSDASFSAVARPCPNPAPVTMAILPSSLAMVFLSISYVWSIGQVWLGNCV